MNPFSIKIKNIFFSPIILIVILFRSVNFSQETVPAQNHKFILVGDTQHIGFWESLYWDYWNEHNEKKTKLLLKEISNREPDFILHLGDMTKDGSKKSAWAEFDKDNKPIFEKKIPYYPVFGNHEYFGSSSNMYKNFYQRFPNLEGKKWYSFVYDKIGFILLNTNFGDLSKKDTMAQRLWYLKQLDEMENDESIKKIIVVSHHPPFTNSTIVSPNPEVLKYFANPFIRSNKGILFFSGHCHSYERFSVNGKIFIVSGGGGGPRQKLNIDKNERIYDDQFNGPALRFFHFCEIETSRDSLFFTVNKLKNDNSFTVTDRFALPK
jgi:3',5'-cyclic AMP phosphodiesterase CpdA